MTFPSDQSQRERFIGELDRNFSVVAAAGSGKTRAITDRIVALARHSKAIDWLPRLLVVTYTNRAAAEMQQRARQSIIGAKVGADVVAAFNRAFFGTIHSLCTKLLRQHGHHIGLPGQPDHLDESNDAAFWSEFVQQQSTLGGSLDPEQRRVLLRIVSAQKLMELGRDGRELPSVPQLDPFPGFDFSHIHAFVPSKVSQAAVARSREALQRWEKAWNEGGFAGRLPACESEPLRDIWDAATRPLRRWVQQASLHVAADVARAYREFRLRHGVMTYDDQVTLAAMLLRDPHAGPRIRAKAHRVILDEAQDTDPAQFDVLLQIARPPEAGADWLTEETLPPRPGHFCMVGDFQQSIFSGRADLDHYRRVHETLVKSGAGEALEFSVTFRLDEAGLRFVNAAVPAVLNGAHRQVNYVQLNARPDILPGQVVRLSLEPPPEMVEWRDWRKAQWEADHLAAWMCEQGMEKLRASSWSEVALLCPRTRWLPALQTALNNAGLAAQVQSQRAIRGDSPAYAWFTALAVVLAEPRNGFELAGVLREIFGLSDQELATYCQGEGWRFRIDKTNVRGGVVGKTLNLLAALHDAAKSLPLFTAMRQAVKDVKLRERLLALPVTDYPELDSELETLLTQAAAAEASGATLETFAADLRDHFTSTREVKATDPNAVQIISGHKAKGSEWDAVIVPFFARQVLVNPPAYPRMLRHPHTREFLAAFDGEDVDGDLKAALEAQARQELERVLYVALTRARHTLVLADDRALFTGKKSLPKNAQAKLLRCSTGDIHAAMFEGLPDQLEICVQTAVARTKKSAAPPQESQAPALIPCPPETVDSGRRQAAHFVKRNPSALAEAASADADPASPLAPPPIASPAGRNAGQIYGTWWHEFVELLDWSAGFAAWDAAFAQALPHSPDPERSQREWNLLREHLSEPTDLGRLLAAPGAIAHAELPFLWAMNERECLDGIIDLAVLDPATGGWLILDWKTNSKTAKELAELSEHYLPQLSAYWQAVGQMLTAPVSAGIYSTATGQWLPYTAEQLKNSWEKLRAKPERLEQVMGED